MGALYDKIATFDRGVADRWKTRSHENLNHKLTLVDTKYIFGPLFKGKHKLKKEYGQAAVALLDTENGGVRMEPDALKRLRKLIENADYADRFNLTRLTTDAELVDVYRALGNDVIGKVMFKSPKTQISYSPSDYLTIRELISQEQIDVFQAETGGMTRIGLLRAYYTAGDDRLVMYEFIDQNARATTIVHEATHAVQDWKDERSKNHFMEADAFIAEAIARRTLTGAGPNDENLNIIDNAAVIALAGGGQPGNAQFEAAYDATVNLLKTSYKNHLSPKLKEKVRESTIYAGLLSHIEMMEQVRESIRKSSEELRKSMEGIDLAKYANRR